MDYIYSFVQGVGITLSNFPDTYSISAHNETYSINFTMKKDDPEHFHDNETKKHHKKQNKNRNNKLRLLQKQ